MWAYDIVSYRLHAPESNQITIVSWQTFDVMVENNEGLKGYLQISYRCPMNRFLNRIVTKPELYPPYPHLPTPMRQDLHGTLRGSMRRRILNRSPPGLTVTTPSARYTKRNNTNKCGCVGNNPQVLSEGGADGHASAESWPLSLCTMCCSMHRCIVWSVCVCQRVHVCQSLFSESRHREQVH